MELHVEVEGECALLHVSDKQVGFCLPSDVRCFQMKYSLNVFRGLYQADCYLTAHFPRRDNQHSSLSDMPSYL